MRDISVFEAKTHLSGLLQEIEDTQSEIVITKHGNPIAVLGPYIKSQKPTSEEIWSQFAMLRREIKGKGLSIDEILAFRDEGRR